MAVDPPPPPSGNRNSKPLKTTSIMLFRIVLSISAIAVLSGAYWQQQLVGLQRHVAPIHSIDNVLRESRRGAVKLKNTTEKVVEVANQEETERVSLQNVQEYTLPQALQAVLDRAQSSRSGCAALDLPELPPPNMSLPHLQDPVADLPNFGIIEALSNYRPSSPQEAQEWNCPAPPSQECNETQFTVIFMGYNPHRLDKMKHHIQSFTDPKSHWAPLVKEVILVWNGPMELTMTVDGKLLKSWSLERNFRIFFPLKEGFPNDLMNRYHPRFNVQTKGILYYDDDGPFYSYEAILAGFELWKRNSNAEIGAMARKIDLSKRQLDEQSSKPFGDREFITQCRDKGDSAKYNFHEFTNYHARMVLPSGSFLHRNYMCFLWHPSLEEIRKFVRAHPVHPDDCTVSTIVSQVGGRAPKVYSRRINAALPVNDSVTSRRRLSQEMRRRLLWADVSEQEWASMRSMAINTLASYFGSINSGSLGWCHDTPYQRQDKRGNWHCDPLMARVGMLPWMTADNRPKDTCP